MTTVNPDSNEENLIQEANQLRNKFLELKALLKEKSGKKHDVSIANLIGEKPTVFSERNGEITKQREEKGRTYKKIIEHYKRINSQLSSKTQELQENIKSEPLKPFDKTLRWWILLIPITLAILVWQTKIADKLGTVVIQRETSVVSIFAVFANLFVVMILLHNFNKIRLKKFPAGDAGSGARIFQTFWKHALIIWVTMYLALVSYHVYLLILASQIKESSGLFWPIKVETSHWFIALPWFIIVLSSINSAFLYMCFLVLGTNIPLRRKNPRIRVRFRYFILILSFLLFLALIDELINDNVLFNGLSMTLFLTYIAATFILLVAKLDSPLFNQEMRIFTMGIIYFYAASVAVLGHLQSGTISAISILAFTIFAYGKYEFGSIINERIRTTDNRSKSSEIISYLEKFYNQ